ncbi:MAG TPA: Asd/ArgC dimerization domain-containing protein, partial [Thermoanaerobaculaceae bacterium]|nr:Asd/ArgC dimerization domain-containing protein [Thermoanaerobaculaceae bacterium]
DAGVRVIDLAADYRIKDVAVWEKWYDMQHASPDWVEQAVYGLPEVNREAIRSARLVANPGCYPTAVQLGFAPLLAVGLVDEESLIADAKSGVSGAGRKAEVSSLFSEASDNFKAYGVPGHRHLPEIRQGLAQVAGKSVGLTFVPHLTPLIRGIHATLYARLNKLGTGLDLMTYYRDNFEIRNQADTRELDLDYQGKIVCGKFVDQERPTFLEAMQAHYRGVLGDKYVPMPPEGGMLHGQD